MIDAQNVNFIKSANGYALYIATTTWSCCWLESCDLPWCALHHSLDSSVELAVRLICTSWLRFVDAP